MFGEKKAVTIPFKNCDTCQCPNSVRENCPRRLQTHKYQQPILNEQKSLVWQMRKLCVHITRHAVLAIIGFRKYSTKQNNINELAGLAFARLADGHKEYGTSLFTMSDEELMRNLHEELADACVYAAEIDRRKQMGETRIEAV